jgi:hypothetical protein
MTSNEPSIAPQFKWPASTFHPLPPGPEKSFRKPLMIYTFGGFFCIEKLRIKIKKKNTRLVKQSLLLLILYK